jgi:hypothetical protein
MRQAKNIRKSRKGGGSKLCRTALVSVRIDPKLRFALELAARKQRRTVSSSVEWACDDMTHSYHVADGKTAYQVMLEVWDPDPKRRLEKLAAHYPELLIHDEELLLAAALNSKVQSPLTDN